MRAPNCSKPGLPSSPGNAGFARILLAVAVSCLVLWPGTGCKRLRKKGAFDPHPAPVTNLASVSLTNRIAPEWLRPPTEPFRLGPGDRIEIEVLGDGTTRADTFVGPDGKIYYHLLPGLDVWGLTLAETKALLERELARYLRSPHVGITLRGVQSKRVWVLGRLNTPGIYPLTAPMTVVESVAMSGGLFASRMSGTTEELADLHHSFLVRGGAMLPVDFYALLKRGDTSQNIYLQADDLIYLPSSLSKEVSVLGAVNMPRTVGFMDQMSLLTAIASAKGTAPKAYLSHVAIVRGPLTAPSIATVDLNAILTGKAPDLMLEPRDIVYVPLRPYRTLERYAELIVNTFVRTVAANEGGRAASRESKPIGVNIGIGN